MSRDIAERWPDRHMIVCATVHQLRGAERDVIFYDAVDCYRMQYPGMLLTSNTNNYANRLYNVALTRVRGKFLSVVNADYMRTKNISQSLMFREMIEENDRHSSVSGNAMLTEGNTAVMKMGAGNDMDRLFLSELSAARFPGDEPHRRSGQTGGGQECRWPIRYLQRACERRGEMPRPHRRCNHSALV